MVIVDNLSVTGNMSSLRNLSGLNISPVVAVYKLDVTKSVNKSPVKDNVSALKNLSGRNISPVVTLYKLDITKNVNKSPVKDNVSTLITSSGRNISPVVSLYKLDMTKSVNKSTVTDNLSAMEKSPGINVALLEVTPADQSIRKAMPKEHGRPQKNLITSTPTAAKNLQDRNMKTQLTRKRLIEKKSVQEESFDELVPKRARRELAQKSEAVSSSDPSGILSTETKTVMTVEGASESDLSDGEDNSTFSRVGVPRLSEYEKKRLKNIRENAKFFASLNMLESATSLRRSVTKRRPPLPRQKKLKPDEEVVSRKSMRLQRLDPEGTPLPELPVKPETDYITRYVMKPAGPLQMVLVNEEQDDAFHDFQKGWNDTFSKVTMSTNRKQADNLERYRASLDRMTIEESYVCKVVRGRIYSMAIHPSETPVLIAAGDAYGGVGVWNLSKKNDPSHEVFIFEPHIQQVCCMHFSPTNPSQLFSLSYDGTVRCGDFTKTVFDEVYRTDFSLSSFDFLGQDGSTLILSHFDGGLAIVDRRTPGTSHEVFGTVEMGVLRTVHVHPEDRHYFVGCGGRTVNIYDVRQVKNKKLQNPVASLKGHSRNITSAYFSPTLGKRVVTTCYDDRLRVYDTSCILSNIDPLSSIRHNNFTGRWLTSFRAVWDPKREDCFVVGSMSRPRQIEVFHETGSLLHTFFNMDYLASVCSINVMHPTRNVLAGGNSSGRVHVFMD
ncbi:WD repeat-containing protein 76 isoform X1 [Protopterus annectens]|uniref:WD repeat-containing protein 76 isoform X1 n=2 Tax=Protopterus annectens TaxID=7888 RepID=UPI001CF9BF8C|nr:WD repeat-containing protein 76 isoform X1 [Protopterus annectens]